MVQVKWHQWKYLPPTPPETLHIKMEKVFFRWKEHQITRCGNIYFPFSYGTIFIDSD